ncbi:MAG: cyclic nucleotide-binding domain-containing protein [Solirubrobacteraceae bacterium]
MRRRSAGDTDTIRTALLGPGRAFGHARLLAGAAAAADAVARERSVVLVVEADQLERELSDDTFAAATEDQTVAELRQAQRPRARMAATGPLAATKRAGGAGSRRCWHSGRKRPRA